MQKRAAENAVADVTAPRARTTTFRDHFGDVYRLAASPPEKAEELCLENNVKFTFSQIKYIICFYRLSQNGYGVKNVELATTLGLSKPSVHNMLKSLAELGVIRQEVFGLAFFTEEGRLLAQKYAHCYTVLENKLSEICGNDVASENAVCALLADMPLEKLNALYDGKVG